MHGAILRLFVLRVVLPKGQKANNQQSKLTIGAHQESNKKTRKHVQYECHNFEERLCVYLQTSTLCRVSDQSVLRALLLFSMAAWDQINSAACFLPSGVIPQITAPFDPS